MIKNIVILGASITSCEWLTWKDFLHIESGINVIDLSTRGAGNEYIVTTLVKNQHLLGPNTLVVVMLTNVDKFDWYVENETFLRLQPEKHQPNAISANSGFWSTGSWFPKDKEIYFDNFYSLDYFTTKSIQQIILLESLCKTSGTSLEIFFDSPIWSYTEQTINNIGKNQIDPVSAKTNLLLQPLSMLWSKQLPIKYTYDSESFIGYCWDNNLKWYTDKYKVHPPSGSHWRYYSNKMKPVLLNYLKLETQNFVEEQIKKFDAEWEKQ